MKVGKRKPTRARCGAFIKILSELESTDSQIIGQQAQKGKIYLTLFVELVVYCFLGALNTLEIVVLRPTTSGIFYCLSFFYGWGAVVRKAIGIAISMFRTPRPPYAPLNVAGGYQSQIGDMSHV